MPTGRTLEEQRRQEAIASARAKFSQEYEQQREIFERQGISKDAYIRSRSVDEGLPEATAEPKSYDELVKALANQQAVDEERLQAILKIWSKSEAELRLDVVNHPATVATRAT